MALHALAPMAAVPSACCLTHAAAYPPFSCVTHAAAYPHAHLQERVAAVEAAGRFQDKPTEVLSDVEDTTDGLRTQVRFCCSSAS